MGVGQKNVPKMVPWQMEPRTKICGPLVLAYRGGACVLRVLK